MKYRITAGRWDIATHQVSVFEAISDKVAREHYESLYKNNPSYAWDNLTLLRIDQEEKTTPLDYRGHQKN